MIGTINLTEQLSDCEVGVAKEITILVTPTQNDPGAFAADVEQLVDYEHEEAEATGEYEREEMPMKGGKSRAPAVAIVIGTGKRK